MFKWFSANAPICFVVVFVCVVVFWYWVVRRAGPLRVIIWWLRDVRGVVPVESAVYRYCDVNVKLIDLIRWLDGQVRKYPVHDTEMLNELIRGLKHDVPDRDDLNYPVITYLADMDTIEAYRGKFETLFEFSPTIPPLNLE